VSAQVDGALVCAVVHFEISEDTTISQLRNTAAIDAEVLRRVLVGKEPPREFLVDDGTGVEAAVSWSVIRVADDGHADRIRKSW